MAKTYQPRANYGFNTMKPGELMRITIPEDDPRAGARALCAAYAYGRRNGQKFFGKKEGEVMVIGRAA